MTKRDRNQGQLESEILDVLWDAKGSESPALTSGEVLASIGGALALTTVLTVLSRLIDKKLIGRHAADGRGFVFEALQTREQHHAQLLLRIVESDSNLSLTFAHFAKGLSGPSLKSLKDSLELDSE